MSSQYGLNRTGNCETCSLKSEGFFCNLPREALKAMDGVKLTTCYPKGAVLFGEQEDPRGVHQICRGRVKLSINSSKGKTVILRIAQPGEVLGLNAVVSCQPYQASAATLEPCQVTFIRREDFLRFLSRHTEAALHAARHLSASYQKACEQIRSLGLAQSASERLARFLLSALATGQQTKQGTRVRITMTHEEIGQAIGTTRETVTRTLSELRNRRLVAVNGSMLLIPNKAALESFAGV